LIGLDKGVGHGGWLFRLEHAAAGALLRKVGDFVIQPENLAVKLCGHGIESVFYNLGKVSHFVYLENLLGHCVAFLLSLVP
jgi:hypothetical protein